jgi:3'-phosphoadenosine 5'-phosphosulfate sulfotransferase (PAPS reductase)/FAD synthetase
VSDPFKIHGPAVINFSSGKSSALLLRKCLDAGLDPDVFVVIENTGKEREESLDFAHRIETEWGVDLVWLEREPNATKNVSTATTLERVAADETITASALLRDQIRMVARQYLQKCWRRVTYQTADRDGRVFGQLIEEHDYLPNPITRYCSTEMKTLTVERWMRSQGFENWTEVMGLRADEPERVGRMKSGAGRKYREVVCPLAEAGIVKADVDAFWASQAFTLQLNPWEGNCDLCHLKGYAKIKRIARDTPQLFAWWIAQERKQWPRAKLKTFRNDRPDYATILETVQAAKSASPMFSFVEEPANDLDDLGDCVCTGAP